MAKAPSRETLMIMIQMEHEHTREMRKADRRERNAKAEAVRTALVLARDRQDRRDEDANNLRSQIESERGSYVTKDILDAAVAKIDAQLARARSEAWTRTISIAAVLASIGGGLLWKVH